MHRAALPLPRCHGLTSHHHIVDKPSSGQRLDSLQPRQTHHRLVIISEPAVGRLEHGAKKANPGEGQSSRRVLRDIVDLQSNSYLKATNYDSRRPTVLIKPRTPSVGTVRRRWLHSPVARYRGIFDPLPPQSALRLCKLGVVPAHVD
jgi:hypothetical protein